MTRHARTSALALCAALLCTPLAASACDLHGSWLRPMAGAEWQTYTPLPSAEDAGARNASSEAATLRPERRKPNFSFAAKRASERALAAREGRGAKVAEREVKPPKSGSKARR